MSGTTSSACTLQALKAAKKISVVLCSKNSGDTTRFQSNNSSRRPTLLTLCCSAATQEVASLLEVTLVLILITFMCLKFDSEENEIFLLEATSNLGVHLKRFSNVVPHLGGFYTKVALRHLDFERTE